MGTKAELPLRVFFFPLMAPGHMLPMIDIAKLFAGRGVATTIIVTPGNEPLARAAISRAHDAYPSPPHPIRLLLLPFPSSVLHLLPGGHENLSEVYSSDLPDFFTAIFALEDPFTRLLRAHHPDCLISDSKFPWTADIALRLGIPRLIFHGTGIFSLCVHDSLELHNNSKDSSFVVIKDIPDRIELQRNEVPQIFQASYYLNLLTKAEEKSYGVIVNSFYELEPAYADHYRKRPGRRAWYVGPVSLCNEAKHDKVDRGVVETLPKLASWLAWLDSKPTGSVVYVCFGSLCEFSKEQVEEIAFGLENSGHFFVWVVRNRGPMSPEWLPEEFEQRVEDRGLVIKGWAPQLVIMEHVAVGGFVTHCGWNSTLEGIVAGVPMVTWPLTSEQFVNEKFINEVIRIGVGIRRDDQTVVVKRQEVAEAVRSVMDGGDEAEERRKRVGTYAAMARDAIGEGGSSWSDLSRLIEKIEKCRRGNGDGEFNAEV